VTVPEDGTATVAKTIPALFPPLYDQFTCDVPPEGVVLDSAVLPKTYCWLNTTIVLFWPVVTLGELAPFTEVIAPIEPTFLNVPTTRLEPVPVFAVTTVAVTVADKQTQQDPSNA
jgi:hypothetical protein